MSADTPAADATEPRGDTRLALLLAMAMFVLVVDTSLMNVSISYVVRDLHTTVSGVQSAIALEALVSAAFILIGSKIGDLIGRKRAYVIGLLGYAAGALAMTLSHSFMFPHVTVHLSGMKPAGPGTAMLGRWRRAPVKASGWPAISGGSRSCSRWRCSCWWWTRR